ncbi:ArsR family transcriptional regulator [Macrococcus hajekii]|uniref:ArsR family transcriptional regulator n=1 Tax=Macrococcus hajekii TaxID=198482 RepID=A0A4R6BJ33_9STAP|nr:metalloregulator ArsR/SmtB family transcription factor [Macrococcus hajekii]TDM01703.1 ArsR family transcriptional regulator [Macrococcus hajekii]GGB06700.1 transcriptional regulator [Macrococcus hajekii]
MNYDRMAQIFKVLSDKNRVEILDLLSCGPLCACDILSHFDVTQPTLSHHMKQLVETGLVESWREGKNTMYQLNAKVTSDWLNLNQQLFTADERCICHSMCGDEQ